MARSSGACRTLLADTALGGRGAEVSASVASNNLSQRKALVFAPENRRSSIGADSRSAAQRKGQKVEINFSYVAKKG